MIKIIVIIFFAASLLFTPYLARGEEKILSESMVIASIRPKIEYVTEGAKEPFLDYFTKSEPVEPPKAEVMTTKVIEEEIRPKPELPILKVQGIIWGGSVPCAIINNEVIKQGGSIANVQLIKIGKDNIEVLYEGWDYTLSSPASLGPDKEPEGGEDE